MSSALHESAPVADNPQRPDKSSKLFFIGFLVCLVALALTAAYVFPRVIDGDAVGYANAVKVYQGTVQLPIPLALDEYSVDIVTVHRILTTALGIEALRIFSEIFDSVILGWIVWDTLVFLGMSVLFYRLLERFFQSPRVAFVGGLFFAGNYSLVAHGLGLFMDIGGWFFYILTIYLLFRYIESRSYRDLLFAAVAIAIGGFFKENVFVAVIPVAAILLYEQYRSPLILLARSIPLGLIVLVPTMLWHFHIYLQYGYLYTYWVRLAGTFEYSSLIAEYIKSLGSLLTFLAPVALAGSIIFLRGSGFVVDTKRKVFLAGVIISTIPALMWPAITQRVLFLILPWVIILAGFCIKRYEHQWYVFLPILALYILAAFTMDSFILDFVNLPI